MSSIFTSAFGTAYARRIWIVRTTLSGGSAIDFVVNLHGNVWLESKIHDDRCWSDLHPNG